MTPELEKYYNTYFDLFTTDGWKQLLDDIKAGAADVNSVEAAKNNEDLFFRKGQLATMAYLLNFEALINQGYESAQEQEAA